MTFSTISTFSFKIPVLLSFYFRNEEKLVSVAISSTDYKLIDGKLKTRQ